MEPKEWQQTNGISRSLEICFRGLSPHLADDHLCNRGFSFPIPGSFICTTEIIPTLQKHCEESGERHKQIKSSSVVPEGGFAVFSVVLPAPWTVPGTKQVLSKCPLNEY